MLINKKVESSEVYLDINNLLSDIRGLVTDWKIAWSFRKCWKITYTSDMASYFDEHDCEPLADGEQPNHMLHMAR